jgi:ArsR family transcriptional regulator
MSKYETTRRAEAEVPDLPLDDDALVRVFKALAHEKRFRMVRELAAQGETSCGFLGGCVEMPQPTVSHHLKLLVDAGVVIMRRVAQRHYLSLNVPLLQSIGHVLPQAAPPRRRRRA